jgi:DNA-binding GntR family transcriptional regulator
MSDHRKVVSTDWIYNELRKEIQLGIIAPGSRLLEVNLAKRFQTSRHQIRETLRKLESKGMVSNILFKGASVIVPSFSEIQMTYEVQSALEGLACLLSIPKLSNKDIKKLTNLNHRMEKITEGRMEEWQALNISFHRVFIEKSGNQKIIQIIRELYFFAHYWYLHIVLSVPGTRYRYTEDHGKIIKAAQKRDADLARRIMEEHILKAASEVVSALKSLPNM